MTAALIWAGLAIAGILAAWFGKRKTTGQPTPEEARVHVEAQNARDAIDAATTANVAAVPGKTDAEIEEEINR